MNIALGYGGSCFPKDLKAFRGIAEQLGYDFRLLREVEAINEDQKARFVRKIRRAVWNLQDKPIALLGIAFKPNTGQPDADLPPCVGGDNNLERFIRQVKIENQLANRRDRQTAKTLQEELRKIREAEPGQRLPGLCASASVNAYSEPPAAVWKNYLGTGICDGWARWRMLAVFEGEHAGTDPDGHPLFLPIRLVAVAETDAIRNPTGQPRFPMR